MLAHLQHAIRFTRAWTGAREEKDSIDMEELKPLENYPELLTEGWGDMLEEAHLPHKVSLNTQTRLMEETDPSL
jgi:hypothetical protein